MFPTHVALIIGGKTTVESFAGRDQIDVENATLHREFGYVFNDHNKRKVRKRWKEEFGGIEVDERWAVGSYMDRWRQEMGTHWLGWICKLISNG
jgi:palmitoyltransferase